MFKNIEFRVQKFVSDPELFDSGLRHRDVFSRTSKRMLLRRIGSWGVSDRDHLLEVRLEGVYHLRIRDLKIDELEVPQASLVGQEQPGSLDVVEEYGLG